MGEPGWAGFDGWYRLPGEHGFYRKSGRSGYDGLACEDGIPEKKNDKNWSNGITIIIVVNIGAYVNESLKNVVILV